MRLQPIQQNGLYGFADKDGNVVIPCQWREARGFHSGRAWVRSQEGAYGFIDQSGALVIPCRWQRVYYDYPQSYHQDAGSVSSK